MNGHIDGDDYTYPAIRGQADRWPLTGPEHTAAEIADVRRDLANALAVIQDQNRRLAVLEHQVRLLEAAEGTP